MHAISHARLEAARHEIASMRVPSSSSLWQWVFYHPETRAQCRATFDGQLLRTTVEDVPVSAGPFDWEEVDQAFAATAADLEARGIARTALPNVAAALRELRLIASGSLREIAP